MSGDDRPSLKVVLHEVKATLHQIRFMNGNRDRKVANEKKKGKNRNNP